MDNPPLSGPTQRHFPVPGRSRDPSIVIDSPGFIPLPHPGPFWTLPEEGGAVLSLGNCRFSAPAAKRKITALSGPWSGSKGVLSHYLSSELWYDWSWYQVAFGRVWWLAGAERKGCAASVKCSGLAAPGSASHDSGCCAAAAAAFNFFFFPEKCRVQTTTPSAQAASYWCLTGSLIWISPFFLHLFRLALPSWLSTRGSKNAPYPKSVPLLLYFFWNNYIYIVPAWVCTFWPQEWHAACGHWPLSASFWKRKACVKEPLLWSFEGNVSFPELYGLSRIYCANGYHSFTKLDWGGVCVAVCVRTRLCIYAHLCYFLIYLS